MSRARLYADTLATLRFEQLAGRALHVARARLWEATPALAAALWAPPADAPSALHAVLETRALDPLALRTGDTLDEAPGTAATLARARRTAGGVCTWLELAASFRPPVDWRAEDRPKLWRYHLHYHAELVELGIAARVTGNPSFTTLLRALVRDWIGRCPPGLGDAWEPYPLSRRLVHWAHALSLVRGSDAAFDALAAKSFAQQRLFLAWHVEHHLLGNHLLANRVALAVADCALGRDPRRSLSHLRAALATQLLADGLHCERTPSYHALVVDDLLAVHAALAATGTSPPPWLCGAIGATTRALVDLLHPDGELPLLNDTAFGQAPPAAELLDPRSLRRRLFGGSELARHLRPPRPRAWLADAGLFAARDANDFLVFDAGPLGPPHLAGHGHSDTLGFELSHRGRRVLVDSGVGTYAPGEARDYFRSARAHNVVTVDLAGPDALWAAFRTGARGVAGPLAISDRDGVVHLDAQLRAPAGWVHRRRLWWAPGLGLAVHDTVDGAPPGAVVRAHIHVHPDLGATRVSDGFELTNGTRLCALSGDGWEGFKGDPGPPLRGFYADHLGASKPAWELAISSGGDGRRTLRWAWLEDPGWRASAAALTRPESR